MSGYSKTEQLIKKGPGGEDRIPVDNIGLEDLIKEVLIQLRIMNIHLSIISNEEKIGEKDI